MMLENGTSCNIQTDDGETLLHQALFLWAVKDNVKLIEEMLRFGADCNVRDEDEHTPFFSAVQI